MSKELLLGLNEGRGVKPLYSGSHGLVRQLPIARKSFNIFGKGNSLYVYGGITPDSKYDNTLFRRLINLTDSNWTSYAGTPGTEHTWYNSGRLRLSDQKAYIYTRNANVTNQNQIIAAPYTSGNFSIARPYSVGTFYFYVYQGNIFILPGNAVGNVLQSTETTPNSFTDTGINVKVNGANVSFSVLVDNLIYYRLSDYASTQIGYCLNLTNLEVTEVSDFPYSVSNNNDSMRVGNRVYSVNSNDSYSSLDAYTLIERDLFGNILRSAIIPRNEPYDAYDRGWTISGKRLYCAGGLSAVSTSVAVYDVGYLDLNI